MSIRRLILITGVTFATAVLGAAIFDGYDSYREHIARAEREAERSRQVLTDRVQRLFASAERSLRAAAHAREMWLADPARTIASAFRQLRAIADSSDAIQHIAWIDANGVREANSRNSESAPMSLADRDYFRHHARELGRGPLITPPMRAFGDGDWVSPISLRMEDEGGHFTGVVLALLDLHYFEALLNRFHATNGASYAMLHRSGTFLARVPDGAKRIGTAARQAAFRNPSTPAGILHAVSHGDGTRRIYSFGALKDYPVSIVVGISRDAALASWHSRIRITGTLTALALLGALAAMLLILRQTHRLEREERAALDARLAAEHANRAKTEFLAHMSHEMRTPMNAILGFTEMMRREVFGPVGSPKYREYLGHVAQSGQHLLQVVNNILDLAKVEAGKWVMEEERVEIGKVVAEAIQLVAERAKGEAVRLVVDSGVPPLQVLADPRLLRQILLNLLANGIKFTPAGGIVRIAWRLERDGSAAITVSDTGCGMTATDITRVLEPFGRGSADLARTRHDTGLGLPISKRFAEMHGGTFEIASVVDKGTVFTIRLPAHRVIRSAPQEKAA